MGAPPLDDGQLSGLDLAFVLDLVERLKGHPLLAPALDRGDSKLG